MAYYTLQELLIAYQSGRYVTRNKQLADNFQVAQLSSFSTTPLPDPGRLAISYAYLLDPR
jgi:hypothetical protein